MNFVKFHHITLSTEINNTVDGGSSFLTPLTVDANDATLRLELHWYDLLWICCKLGCIIYLQQIDQVKFEHYRSNI